MVSQDATSAKNPTKDSGTTPAGVVKDMLSAISAAKDLPMQHRPQNMPNSTASWAMVSSTWLGLPPSAKHSMYSGAPGVEGTESKKFNKKKEKSSNNILFYSLLLYYIYYPLPYDFLSLSRHHQTALRNWSGPVVEKSTLRSYTCWSKYANAQSHTQAHTRAFSETVWRVHHIWNCDPSPFSTTPDACSQCDPGVVLHFEEGQWTWKLDRNEPSGARILNRHQGNMLLCAFVQRHFQIEPFNMSGGGLYAKHVDECVSI